MPDNDVVEISVSGLKVTRYFSRVGTINLGLAVQPDTGDLWVANTDARNLVRFEPNLQGHIIDNRVSKISISNGQVTAFDLNPGIDYRILPNPGAVATALSQPAATVFDPSGSFMWVAAFGTDRVAKVSNAGTVLGFVEIGNALGANADPRNKRGPRGLVWNANAARLYVLNRISNTISVVDAASNTVTKELFVGSYDPTPTVIRNGRGFLYDAKLSGNGTAACASCHIDAEMDLLAWDLGNPNGNMKTVQNPVGILTFQMHPMKGPMTTQTLRGLKGLPPFHWRGDKAQFTDFNPAFQSLLGGSQLASADMQAFSDFINTVLFMANPNQNLDRSLPSILGPGNPISGNLTFQSLGTTGPLSCNACHTQPGPGTNLLIFPASKLVEFQAFKAPQLRSVYQKLNYTPAAASSIDGFGLVHEGHFSSVTTFLGGPQFQLNSTQKANLDAYIQCFDTGTAPAAGYSVTLSSSFLGVTSRMNDWNTLQSQARTGNVDLIAKGTISGQLHGLLYQPSTGMYASDKTGLGPFSQAQLTALLGGSDVLTFMGVYPGTGTRMGIDRNLDGVLDGDQ
jgi:YVTN family beta-propeller protein